MTVCSVAPQSSFASNCYLVVAGDEALVVDPSASTEAIGQALQKARARCVGILLTHGHFDHMLSLDALRDAFSHVPVYLHKGDAAFLSDGQKNAFSLFFGQDRQWRPATHLLQDGDTITLADEVVTVLHTPGHTPGSACFICGEQALITGDTLFDGSYGRYDLYGGSLSALRESLGRLATLDGRLTIYPGHGNSTELSHALRVLPFL